MAATGHVLLPSSCDGGTQEPCALGGHRQTPASKSRGPLGVHGELRLLPQAGTHLTPTSSPAAAGHLSLSLWEGLFCRGCCLGGGAPWRVSRASPRLPIHMKAPGMQTGLKPSISDPFQGPLSVMRLEPRRALFTHMHTHSHTLKHTHINTHIHTHIHTCSHTHMFTHIYSHTHMLTHMHIQAHIHTLTHRCSHTHMHTHTHT